MALSWPANRLSEVWSRPLIFSRWQEIISPVRPGWRRCAICKGTRYQEAVDKKQRGDGAPDAGTDEQACRRHFLCQRPGRFLWHRNRKSCAPGSRTRIWRSKSYTVPMRKGLILMTLAGNVLRIQPPVNISPNLLRGGFSILSEAISEVAGGQVSDSVLSYRRGRNPYISGV